MPKAKAPNRITLHKARAELELSYGANTHILKAELLRVCSPSAEVQGHGPNQKQVPLDKGDVKLVGVEAQGNYAIKLVFDDGHDSGIYTWSYLYDLCTNQEQHWQDYLQEAELERAKRDGPSPVKWVQR